MGQNHTRKQLGIEHMASLKHWGEPPSAIAGKLDRQAIVDCGWGRLIFGQTFNSNSRLAEFLCDEQSGQRDVALYARDPQVVVSKAPQSLFIDPSLTYRLNLPAKSLDESSPDYLRIRRLEGDEDTRAINRIYKARGMVTVREEFYRDHDDAALQTLVAVDTDDGRIVGCVTGVDHYLAFEDPDNGSSLWALAVDPQYRRPGAGKALVVALARNFQAAGRSFMDLSVMHDNEQAIKLYEALDFYQVPVYCVKTRNTINQQLYTGDRRDGDLNVYARIIIDEAYRRGIRVDIIDSDGGFFDLSLGGRSISCRESLTDLTSAVAMSRCADKEVTNRFLSRAGLEVTGQTRLANADEALDFLQQHGRIVIKPAEGEQGEGVFVDLRREDEVRQAWAAAAAHCDKVLGEAFFEGQDLRIIVIDERVVAAAVRAPASIVGDGVHRIDELIDKQSRRRSAATQGESAIPVDAETRRCVRDAGYDMQQVLDSGIELQVRKTANLHTGGTLHDVTEALHPELADAAIRGALALDMPLVGFDFIVEDPASPGYVVIEANERPGLANHEPQPTAERFIDMLFPQTATIQDRPHETS
ncbi:MAG: N-acetylglutaminylglutamine synthetase [Gammaproteobacteria bacterium]|jgi:GNAT-family acetyltransferase (TIGR03103 family)